MFIRVIGTLNATGNRKTQSYEPMNRYEISSFIPLKCVEQINHYPTWSSVGWDIGTDLLDALLFDAGFCKEDEHTHVWEDGMDFKGGSDRCECILVPEDGVYILHVRGKEHVYVVHPDENNRMKKLVSSTSNKRRKIIGKQ